MQAICNAMAEMIRRSGKSVRAISQLSGIPESTIRNIMHGRTEDPYISTVAALCHACGTTTSQLFRSIDDMQEPEDDILAAHEHLQRAIAAREQGRDK